MWLAWKRNWKLCIWVNKMCVWFTVWWCMWFTFLLEFFFAASKTRSLACLQFRHWIAWFLLNDTLWAGQKIFFIFKFKRQMVQAYDGWNAVTIFQTHVFVVRNSNRIWDTSLFVFIANFFCVFRILIFGDNCASFQLIMRHNLSAQLVFMHFGIKFLKQKLPKIIFDEKKNGHTCRCISTKSHVDKFVKYLGLRR